ncbi:MAG: tRNA uridine-5-carboxymethylaminomethyl(34) synthesis GTPase MnmE [Bacillota bacterium]
MLEDTIAAISTPIGEAGIGIVRMSGKNAVEIGQKLFRGRKPVDLAAAESHKLLYGHLIEPETGNVVDEVLVSVMRAPHSFTAEDVVEINCHGGVVAVRKALECVIKAGARLAEPGEFTKRAFLNGRLDLAQAESVMDLINAKTEKSLKVAVRQLAGGLSAKVRDVRQALLKTMAHIEAGIDFPEHDIEELSREQVTTAAREVLAEIEQLIDTAESGKILREGLRTVILGKPNVGKSSLLNALLHEKRAIVTDIPGTTRDVIEEFVSIKGIPLKIIDTAGIRETDDLVEKIGVEKTKEMLEEADLVLFMLDAATGIEEEDRLIAGLVSGKTGFMLINKTDLRPEMDLGPIAGLTEGLGPVKISLRTGAGLEELKERIVQKVMAGQVDAGEGVMVTNVRHRNALAEARDSLQEVLNTLALGMPTDCMAIDLRNAWEKLGEISGETLGEDVIDRIFSEFCIGK